MALKENLSAIPPAQVEDLDQMNAIHVTGTKGKVREAMKSDVLPTLL